MNTVIAQAYVRIKGNIKKRYKALTEKGFVVIQVHPSRNMFRRTWAVSVTIKQTGTAEQGFKAAQQKLFGL